MTAKVGAACLSWRLSAGYGGWPVLAALGGCGGRSVQATAASCGSVLVLGLCAFLFFLDGVMRTVHLLLVFGVKTLDLLPS